MKPQDGRTRIFYLDSVRAFCMFFGIFTHGTTIAYPVRDDYPIFELVVFLSEFFRNATFFFVSGYLTTLVWTRNDPRSYAENRLNTLFVPLMASLIFISPVTNWMIHVWHNGPIGFLEYLGGGWRRPTIGNEAWALHFWFLFSLLFYAALTPALFSIARRPWFERGLDLYLARAGRLVDWTNVLIFALAVVAGKTLYDQLFRHIADGTPFEWIVRASLNFLPIFAFGVISFTHQRFLDSLLRFNPLGLALFLILHLSLPAVSDGLPRPVERTLYFVFHAGVQLFMITGLLWAFKRWFNKPSQALSFAVEAAYPFYLFHFTFIYILAFLLRPFLSNLVVMWVAIIILGIPLVLLWHALVIRRFPITRRLFMGKPPKSSRRLESEPT